MFEVYNVVQLMLWCDVVVWMCRQKEGMKNTDDDDDGEFNRRWWTVKPECLFVTLFVDYECPQISQAFKHQQRPESHLAVSLCALLSRRSVSCSVL